MTEETGSAATGVEAGPSEAGLAEPGPAEPGPAGASRTGASRAGASRAETSRAEASTPQTGAFDTSALRGQIAGYQIEAEIGHGGMATVYRALDVKLGRRVALKILAPRLAQDDSFRRRFIHESHAAAAVDHPHIVPVFEAGESGGVLFIAMRYVGTGDVRTLLERQGSLPVDRAIAITTQVASALDAASARGLVHRDVKPANMLLAESADGRTDHVYLSDFGLSKHSLAPSGLTAAGQFMGTLDYVAPEQIEGHAVDGRADQYSLACAAVEMLTGAPPFRRNDNVALMWAQLSEPPPSLRERRSDLPEVIDQVMARAMAKSPADRYPTCLDFAAALRAASVAQAPGAGQRGVRTSAGPSGGQVQPDLYRSARTSAGPSDRQVEPDLYRSAQVPAPTPPRPKPRKRRRRGTGLGIAACLIVLIALGAVGYKLLNRTSDTSIRADTGRQPGSKTVTRTVPATSTAGAVVQGYFAAIDRHHYRVAWRLGGRYSHASYARFVAGFAGTAHDSVRILSESGATATARITARQSNGTRKVYQGTYTVVGGRIVSSYVRRVR